MNPKKVGVYSIHVQYRKRKEEKRKQIYSRAFIYHHSFGWMDGWMDRRRIKAKQSRANGRSGVSPKSISP